MPLLVVPNPPTPNTDIYHPQDAIAPLRGMIAAGASLRHFLSHGTSYQQSWADGVGGYDALVLEAAPELLRCTDLDSNNEKLRTLRFSPRPIAANAASHIYPRNANPPAPFAPRTARDVQIGSALAAIEG
jgi:hypothetical protein